MLGLELRAIVDDEDPRHAHCGLDPRAMTMMQLDAIWFASSCLISAAAWERAEHWGGKRLR
jgi:hypothetical protein